MFTSRETADPMLTDLIVWQHFDNGTWILLARDDSVNNSKVTQYTLVLFFLAVALDTAMNLFRLNV